MISIILPVYNEENNIKNVISNITGFFNKKKLDFEIIAVDDGSKDKTGEILESYKNIAVVTHDKNIGYGAALRSGFNVAKGDLIFFMDSDNQFDISDFDLLRKEINSCDFVVGYRQKRQDPLHRIVYAQIFRLIARIFFRIKVKDVDCAFKLFKSHVLSGMQLKQSGSLINLEIFSFSRRKGYKFTEVPVRHFPRKEGKQTGGDFLVLFRAVLNLFKFWFKYLDENIKCIIFLLLSSIAATFLIGYAFSQDSTSTFFGIWNRWDAIHYLNIAMNGYVNYGDGQFSIVFFPFYPLVVRIFSVFLRSYLASALFVSNIAFALSFYFFYRLLRKDFSKEVSLNAVLFFIIFPTSYFLHIGYAESLFVLLAILSFYCARCERWLLASILGMLAGLTRIYGIFLFPAIAYEYFFAKKGKFKKDAIFLFIIPLGTLIYLAINFIVFKNPFQFTVFYKEHWFKFLSFPWNGFLGALYDIRWRDFSDWIMVDALEIAFAFFGIFMILISIRKIRFSYSLFAILNLLLVLSTNFWLSTPRYLISIFPIFISMSIVSSKRFAIFYLFFIVSIILEGFFILKFVNGFWAF